MNLLHLNCRPSLTAALAAVLGAAVVTSAAAQDIKLSAEAIVEQESRTRRQVKLFDFDERAEGNYESIPMYWTKLHGPGLPEYAKGAFDPDVGHLAPPSFRLSLNGGNIAYVYKQRDLAIDPQSDYLVVGFVKTQQLKYSRSFIAASFLDRFGDQIPGSHRVSNLAGAAADDNDEWQRLELVMPGKFPNATAVRLDLWLAQTYVWADSQSDTLDPIVRQDIHGVAWFDDIAVYRLPRAGLRLSNAGGIVRPGRSEHLIVEAHNFTLKALLAVVTIKDATGKEVHRETSEVADSVNRPIRIALPALGAGTYYATLDLRSGDETLLERSIQFAVLSPLPFGDTTAPEFGIDTGRWRGGDIAGLRELIGASGCGTIKIGVPAIGALTTNEKIAYFDEISKFLREVEQGENIRQTGVILTTSAVVDPENGVSTRSLVASDARWKKKLNPILAHFGGLFKAWQLGEEAIELRGGELWTRAQIQHARDQFTRFVTAPKLVVPSPPTSAPSGGDVRSVLIPASVPARSFPHYLSFLAEPIEQPVWLKLESDRSQLISQQDRLVDLARRITLAATFAPDQLYVEAPFELTTSGGEPAWRPDESYHLVRTLFHYLAGKRAVDVLDYDDDVVAIIFSGNDSGCVVMWTWHEQSAPVTVHYYLGEKPVVTDLWGNRTPLEVVEGLSSITLSPMPVIVGNVDASLAQLHASFKIEPTYLQAHTDEPKPVLSFRNYYAEQMTGTVNLSPPKFWDVEPLSLDFSLQPGESLLRKLDFTIPPRHPAATKDLAVRINLRTPHAAALKFSVPLKLGLAEISVSETITIENGRLIVEQTLKNESDQTVNFSGFCQAVGRPRIWREFRRVQSGDTARQQYVFTNGAALRGTQLHMGLREIRGARTLDRLVEVE